MHTQTTVSTHWKAEIADLRSFAHAVATSPIDVPGMTAREAAVCLSGVIQLVVRRFDLATMQRACADLARCEVAWSTSFGTLPRGVDGRVPDPIEILAMGARGILPIAGAANLRAAVSFWAIETDPSVWIRLAPDAA